MFQLINDILAKFRPYFKRERAWKWFVCVVVAFMVRVEHRGVTSFISKLCLLPRFYEQILHFFRSDAYETEEVYQAWIGITREYIPFEEEGGYVILVADPIKVAKEGRRMPAVHAYHQESENASKREYAEGHQFGLVSAIVNCGNESRSMPLTGGLQVSKTKTGKDSLIEQMVKQGASALPSLNKPGLLTLDAYHCAGSTFKVADSFVDDDGKVQLSIITRAKPSTKGFTVPPPRQPGQKGATRKYGEGVKLYSLFKSAAHEFCEGEVHLYGKIQKVRYLCKDLIWKPACEPRGKIRVIRFVLVEIEGSNKRAVLMCSDLDLHPLSIIRVYGLRFKIETSFDDLKNDLGCFSYHFWTKSLPKKKKWKDVEIPTDEKSTRNIAKARQAIEMHVCACCIASGILTLIGFRHKNDIWNAFSGWLRTIRSSVPSIATTRSSLAQIFHAVLPSLLHLPVFHIIHTRRRALDDFSIAV